MNLKTYPSSIFFCDSKQAFLYDIGVSEYIRKSDGINAIKQVSGHGTGGFVAFIHCMNLDDEYMKSILKTLRAFASHQRKDLLCQIIDLVCDEFKDAHYICTNYLFIGLSHKGKYTFQSHFQTNENLKNALKSTLGTYSGTALQNFEPLNADTLIVNCIDRTNGDITSLQSCDAYSNVTNWKSVLYYKKGYYDAQDWHTGVYNHKIRKRIVYTLYSRYEPMKYFIYFMTLYVLIQKRHVLKSKTYILFTNMRIK